MLIVEVIIVESESLKHSVRLLSVFSQLNRFFIFFVAPKDDLTYKVKDVIISFYSFRLEILCLSVLFRLLSWSRRSYHLLNLSIGIDIRLFDGLARCLARQRGKLDFICTLRHHSPLSVLHFSLFAAIILLP